MRSSNFNQVKILVRADHLSRSHSGKSFLTQDEQALYDGDHMAIAREQARRGLLSYIKVEYRPETMPTALCP